MANDSSFFKDSGATSEISTNLAQRAIDAETAKTAAEAAKVAAETAATNAAASETAAQSSANSASTSSSTASTSATTATTKASEASTSASNASSSASAAATSASNASTSETNAATSATSASTSATAAQSAQTAAETAKTAAETAKTAAETAKTAAETAETNSTSAATSSSNSAATATTQASTATTKASEAATSATNAATSETNASNSASSALTSQTNAATSATNAATSATAASASQVAAAASAASAAAAYDTFDDRYLGTKTSNPTVDNDGDALVEGALYFNSTANEMRVYDGANWIAASSAGTASLNNYHYTATAAQTTFSGADDNSATLSYTVNNLIVTLNGVVLEDGTDYTATNGTSVVLTSGAALNDEVNIVAFKSFTTADMVSATNGGTFQNDITISGDLTVDTNTLFVDASADAVGIGTTSITSLGTGITTLELKGNSASQTDRTGGIRFTRQDGTHGMSIYNADGASYIESRSTYPLLITTNNSEAMRIDSSGNVGVGTSSPSAPLEVSRSDAGIIQYITNTGSSQAYTAYGNSDNPAWSQDFNTAGGLLVGIDSDETGVVYQGGNYALRFGTNAIERMRIEGSSGNLHVGRTFTSSATAGFTAQPNGAIYNAFAGRPYYVNRLSSDGKIIEFAKDGTSIGSISSTGGNTILIDGEASIYCANNVRPNAQDTHDLGSASFRWRDIYTNGAVNTSDQNEKQQIAELTATELAAAKRISALFKTFKWNNAVETKGDNARIHAGIIAQDVKSALEGEGLIASKYSFWCSDTWWEHEVEVPAVEAVAEVLDDDGNVVTEAVEAQDAYTRRDVYDTADEAPEGATEVTQQSVRYNELMAFVGAATEQRLTHLETLEARIEALENA